MKVVIIVSNLTQVITLCCIYVNFVTPQLCFFAWMVVAAPPTSGRTLTQNAANLPTAAPSKEVVQDAFNRTSQQEANPEPDSHQMTTPLPLDGSSTTLFPPSTNFQYTSNILHGIIKTPPNFNPQFDPDWMVGNAYRLGYDYNPGQASFGEKSIDPFAVLPPIRRGKR